MTTTDELRRLLDERGVEWMPCAWEPQTETFYKNGDGVAFIAMESASQYGLLLRTDIAATPAQAIEATLGRGECHPIISDNLTESEGMGDAWADCSECGHLLFVLTDPNSKPPNFCPNCGRRCVG